jgi:hypothetical protein
MATTSASASRKPEARSSSRPSRDRRFKRHYDADLSKERRLVERVFLEFVEAE